MSYDLNCPYCDAELEVCHDDGFGYSEDARHEMNCAECDKNFTFTTYMSFTYSPDKADCLNGAEHKFKKTSTYPRKYTKMICESCDKERPLTDVEMAELMAGETE